MILISINIFWVITDKTFLQEEKSSASRKLIQPDLLAMSQLLNFDEVTLEAAGSWWFAHLPSQVSTCAF